MTDFTRRGTVLTVSIPMTDAPNWLSHFEITRHGDTISIQAVKRSDVYAGEAEIDAAEFFTAIDKLKDF